MGESKKGLGKYIEDLMYFQKHGDEEGEKSLIKSVEGQSTSLSDVAYVLLEIIDDIGQATGEGIREEVAQSQELMEYRMKAIVANLPTEVQLGIFEDFTTAGDTILDEEKQLLEEQEGDKTNG